MKDIYIYTTIRSWLDETPDATIRGKILDVETNYYMISSKWEEEIYSPFPFCIDRTLFNSMVYAAEVLDNLVNRLLRNIVEDKKGIPFEIAASYKLCRENSPNERFIDEFKKGFICLWEEYNCRSSAISYRVLL